MLVLKSLWYLSWLSTFNSHYCQVSSRNSAPYHERSCFPSQIANTPTCNFSDPSDVSAHRRTWEGGSCIKARAYPAQMHQRYSCAIRCKIMSDTRKCFKKNLKNTRPFGSCWPIPSRSCFCVHLAQTVGNFSFGIANFLKFRDFAIAAWDILI